MNAGATAPEWATITASGQVTYNVIIASSGGDYTSLNAYFTAGATAGDRILIRDSHALTASISSSVANLTIVGQGKNDVVIDLSSGYSLTLSGANVTIRDIGFSCGTSTSAKVTLSGDYHNVENINVVSSAVHVDTFNSSGSYGTVTGCNFISAYASTSTSGVFCYFQSQYGHYTNNYVTGKTTGSTASTALIRLSAYAQFVSNTIVVSSSSAADTVCLWVGGTATSVTGNSFYSSASTTQKPQAIVSNGTYQAISANTVTGAWQNGVKITTNSCVISGNVLYTTNSSGAEAVYVDTGADYTTITGNYIEGWATGIHIQSTTCDSTMIASNNIQSVSSPISNGGTGTIMSGNTNTNTKFNNQYRYMANTSGSAMSAGQVVVLKADSSGTQITTTTTAGDDKVLGVMIDAPNNGSSGRVITEGYYASLKVNGTTAIAVGDYLTTYTSAGIAAKAAAGDMCFAMALNAYSTADSLGVIECLVFSPRLI
jgi:hypothetical protein